VQYLTETDREKLLSLFYDTLPISEHNFLFFFNNCCLHNKTYRAFHRFGQAKFAYGGLVFGLEPIYSSAPAASKNDV